MRSCAWSTKRLRPSRRTDSTRRHIAAVAHSAILPGASSDRRAVVGLLILLFVITYLDRV